MRMTMMTVKVNVHLQDKNNGMQKKFEGIVGRHVLGGACVHIKVYCSTLFAHQRYVSVEKASRG